jgi:ribosomal protein S18 acetylase RimI-like enzyme
MSSSGAGVTLRTAAPADVPAIAALHLASWRSAYRDITPVGFLDTVTLESRLARWERTFAPGERERTETVVVVRSGIIVGLCSFGPRSEPASSTIGEIYALHVDPESRRDGLGTLLLDEACRRLRARRFAGAVLWVLRANVNARGFYEAVGWSITGEEHLEERNGSVIPEVRYALRFAA